ncbi:hypothetical protein BJX63DRAFT_416035 [Aspergillus granulosus]|uniref:Uncharacterized protein n=1 Tax=Aspergillus granulosus TaxID=176169 RepID=A0ABR4GSH0_9EURO
MGHLSNKVGHFLFPNPDVSRVVREQRGSFGSHHSAPDTVGKRDKQLGFDVRSPACAVTILTTPGRSGHPAFRASHYLNAQPNLIRQPSGGYRYLSFITGQETRPSSFTVLVPPRIMARTKQTAKRGQKVLITWTRFHLPREQEWPTWSVDHADVHAGPLADVEGLRKISLGRMVENPEQAAYILEWVTLDDLKNFQSSPACAEFLRNLPEDNNSRASIESGSALRHLTLDDAPSPSPPASSRFLTFKHATETPTADVEGRVTFTTFLVPHKVDNMYGMYKDNFNSVLSTFIPRGSGFITGHRNFWYKFSAVWFWVLAEDHWVEEKFGKLEQTQEDNQGRTIFCHFFLWSRKFGATPEHEEASAADPQARESWNQAIARVMPPATAWAQERWDIQRVPRFFPPSPSLIRRRILSMYKSNEDS